MTGSSRSARAATVVRWPLAIAVVSWRYLWRTTPLHRSEDEGDSTDLPADWDRDDDTDLGVRRQGMADGVGPMVHRRYTVWIIGSTMSPTTLVDAVAANLNRASPEIAAFVKTLGPDGPVRDGDEYVVRMPGPWNGPVRAVRRDPTALRLLTLDGHLEAGQIEFRAAADGDALRFDIESWTRAGDRLAELLYNRVRLAKEIQLNMWTHFCLRAAALANGRPRGGVTIVTRSVPWPPSWLDGSQ
ncbi:MAG: DUF1990 family protein [Jatrophihabitantaceae bacterium]